MLNDRFVFSQLIDSLPKHEFDLCVARYHGNRKIHNFSCFDQFLCMAFAQLTYRESLRDIEICLRFNEDRYAEAGLPSRFVQDNMSYSESGVLRGLHYQLPNAQGKLVSVL